VLSAIGKPLEVVGLTHGRLATGQVLVEVAFSGVCRSQLLEVHGLRGPDRFLPHTLGHEGSGVVIETGEGVGKVRTGDHVILTWIKGSGTEAGGTVYIASDGRKVNSGPVSTFLRRAVVSENRVVKIPAGVPLKEAALLGCALPTGAGAVLNTARVKAGETVAVFGLGGVGLSVVLGAKLAHAGMVVAVDVSEQKLELAKRLGATHVVNASRTDPVSGVRSLTGGKGADYAIEAVGRKETMEAAYAAAREGGGLAVIAGNLPTGEKISIDPMSLVRGKRIAGTWGGETDPDRDIPLYADRWLAGELELSALITHTYPLAAVNDALEELATGKVGRAILDMSI
jgi:S-(hydroxymethyl)glutathione dehydrogenase/alcohol dehydrogenase